MDRTLSLIGLAYRAHKAYLGQQCLENMKDIRFLFIASDASAKTRERYLKKCHYYHIDSCSDYDSIALSKALGKRNIRIVGISDEGFRKTIVTSLN